MSRFSLPAALTGSFVCAAVLALSLLSPAAHAQTLYVTDLTFDSNGNLSGNVYAFAPDGTRSTVATNLVPTGIAVDRSGNVFVNDRNTNSIVEITPGGTQSTFTLPGSSYILDGLHFDSSGNLFAANVGNGTVDVFAPDGTASTFVSGLNNPVGVAFDSSGNVYVSDIFPGDAYEYSPTGTLLSTFDTGALFTGGLAVDGNDNLFVADGDNARILEFMPDGTQTTFATGVLTFGLDFDPNGNLFVADAFGGNIFEFMPGGTQTTFASGLSSPGYLAFGPTAVPEPGSVGLLAGICVSGAGLHLRRRKRASRAASTMLA